jgi:hypothetical protein
MNLEPANACEHEANHRQIDHRLAGLGLPFVILAESAVTAQPAKRAFHDPLPRSQNIVNDKLLAFSNTH